MVTRLTALCLLGVLFPVALLLGCNERSGSPTDFIAPELDLVFPGLLLAEGFNGDHAGWQCPQCRVLGLDPAPAACPSCAEPLPERIELREAMVRRAERTGRKVEIVESHPGLEALDGVGALPRYRV